MVVWKNLTQRTVAWWNFGIISQEIFLRNFFNLYILER